MRKAVVCAAQRAFFQVQPEAQSRQQPQLPAHIERRPHFARLDLVEQDRGCLVEGRARRIALVQRAAQEGRHRRDRRQGTRIVQHA